MSTVGIAVHYQDDIVHPHGGIGAGAPIVDTEARLLQGARRRGWPVVPFRRAAEQALHVLGARQVIIAGVATHSAVEHTARHAADVGYDVVVAADACAAGGPDLHAASLRALALHVEQVATVDEIVESS